MPRKWYEWTSPNEVDLVRFVLVAEVKPDCTAKPKQLHVVFYTSLV